MSSINVQRYEDAVRKQFPWATTHYIDQCRKIAGTSVWSDHAWGNADDVMTGSPGSRASRERGDALVKWLFEIVRTDKGNMARWRYFGIRNILWWGKSQLTGNWVADHLDHVHCDFYPRPYGYPTCKGGGLYVVYPGGVTGRSWSAYPYATLLDDKPITYEPEVPVYMPLTKKQAKERPSDVASVAHMMNFAFGLKLPTDGSWGTGMSAAVVKYLGYPGDTGDVVHGKRYANLLIGLAKKAK